MDKKSTKKEEQEQWKELYEYVKTYILQYDESMKLPKNLVLRLRGLRQGKFMANKNTRILGDYTFKVILTTFKLNKFEIIQAMLNKNKFKDESHMINYLMCIVENKINDTYLRIKKVEESQEKGQEIEVDITNNKAEYIHKTKEVKNSRLKDLL
jgi:hypothetical protein